MQEVKQARRARGWFVIAALCFVPTWVYGQTPKEAAQFATPILDSKCVGKSAAFTDYPFSLPRLMRAWKMFKRKPSDVHVLIIDNGFVGYMPNEAEAPPRVEGKNYSIEFFDIEGETDFFPFVDDTDVIEPPDEDAEDSERVSVGHGTHIAGIVLGGMYDEGNPEAGGKSKLQPNVRRLLLVNPNPDTAIDAKPWIYLKIARVVYGSGAASDPLKRLASVVEKLQEIDVVNMSLTQVSTSKPDTTSLPSALGPQSLVVLAAGNATMRLSKNVAAMPGYLDKDPRLLVVGSHDASGRLSSFSNYGGPVAIAAPGCKIMSWLDGKRDATPLSGTSMATAMVSFAAALVRSRWSGATGGALRNRLLASAKFVPELERCDHSATSVGGKVYCVENGAMLDVAVATLINRDYIEYDDCSVSPCVRKSSVGMILSVPTAVASCGNFEPNDNVAYRGLTFNGAIKRTADEDVLLIAAEPGSKIGKNELEWRRCKTESDWPVLEFSVEGDQLDGGAVAQSTLKIEMRNLHRLVTRSLRPD